MSDRESDHDHRRARRRRYSSDSEDARNRKDRAERRRGDKDGGRVVRVRDRDDSRSEDHRTGRRHHRSRSPRSTERDRDRAGVMISRSSRSPPVHRRRRPRDDERKVSRREHGASRSPPPPPPTKRRRRDSRDDDDGRRHSDYYAGERRRKSSPHRRYSRSRSPPPPFPSKRSNAPLPSQNAAFKKFDPTTTSTKPAPSSGEKKEAEEKQKPNYAPTGKLAAETNTVANTSIVLKYNEPPDARLPALSSAWRLYVFKGPTLLDTIKLHERSCWLFGRERTVVDYAAEHPSVSKQHAVLQFRFVTEGGKGKGGEEDEWGVVKEVGKRGGTGVVRPYVIDLESANGTWVNGERVPERRFVEVRSGDVVTFGESKREYVLMLPPKDQPKG